jgi:LuxR family transcriptional regulator, maltose regulon positive regulatory protein
LPPTLISFVSESVTRVMVPDAQALAWFEFGRLAEAADAARTAQATARSLGFDRHFFAVDYLRTLAGLALEPKHHHQNPALTKVARSRGVEALGQCSGLWRTFDSS